VKLDGLLARAWPANLAGRVFFIIIAGLVVAHLASYAFFEVERARAIDRFAAAEVAARIVDAARNPGGTPPPQAGREGGWPLRHRIRWKETDDVGAPPADADQPSSGFAAELRRLLSENFGEDPVAWLSVRSMSPDAGPPRAPAERGDGEAPRAQPRRGPGEPRRPGMAFDRPWRLLTVALRIPGGRQAMVETPLVQASHGIPAEAWVSVALIFTVTALFTLGAARLAVEPVRMLSDAADRLSRNIEEPPLPEKGAADIRAATRAFNRMQDRLRRHVNSRSLAFAAMSHDIRTPLTRMRLRLETLGEDAKARLGDDLDEIEAIAKSVLQMTRDLAPDEKIVSVDVDALVHRLAANYQAMGQAVAVAGNCPTVSARPAALRRALANLIDNALQYGKDVSVELGESREHAVVLIRDRGPGIPADDLAKVVYPFYRVESSRNRDTGGAGLGLAIAKDIIEGQGGELGLANRDGGGLDVTVRLPR
jgi:signal transduction histidine kinase